MSETPATDAIMQRIRSNLLAKSPEQPEILASDAESFAHEIEQVARLLKNSAPSEELARGPEIAMQDTSGLAIETATALTGHRQFGELNPRPSGVHNDAIQFGKKVLRRSLTWYTRPMHLFQGAVIRALQRLTAIVQTHDDSLQALSHDMRQQGSDLTRQVATQRLALIAVTEALYNFADRLITGPSAAPGPAEDKTIVNYWDHAAETDALRETVTPEKNETDEQYLQSWVKVGEYVADKIMSYSPPNPVALEIGPGMGRISIPMSRRCQSILALDISPKMVLRTRETLAGLANFEVKLITDEDLSFLPADHFDLAYAISCFQHADKKSFYRYLRGIRRALKSGGVLFFGVLNLCSEAGWGHFEAIVNNDYPEFFHTPDEISSYLKHAGYNSHQLDYEGETLWAIAHR